MRSSMRWIGALPMNGCLRRRSMTAFASPGLHDGRRTEGKGPGYRVYYTHHRGSVVLLLGSNKTSQDRDIKDAKRLAKHIRAGRRHVE